MGDISAARRNNLRQGRESHLAAAQERRERFAELRRGGFTVQEAAWDLGVCIRTAWRYEKHRKENL